MNSLIIFLAAFAITYIKLIGANAEPDVNKCPPTTPNRWNIPLVTIGEKQFYLGIFFKLNWYRAAQFCRYHAMDLASISSKAENDELIKQLMNYGFNGSNDRFWTSGTDLGKEGSFFWMSNGVPFSFQDWIPGQPDNVGGNEHCLQLWNFSNQGIKWNDAPCIHENYFVCEMQW